MADEQQPKIIVDDDWKSQARAEKEKLSQAAQAKKEAATGQPGAEPPKPGEELGFIDLVRMLATQALMYLGAFPDPQTGKAMVALDVAKLHIDLLEVTQSKTKGNLTDEEQKALDGTLRELRHQFVEISKAVTKAQQEGRINPDGTMSPEAGPGGSVGGGAPPGGGFGAGLGGVGPVG